MYLAFNQAPYSIPQSPPCGCAFGGAGMSIAACDMILFEDAGMAIAADHMTTYSKVILSK